MTLPNWAGHFVGGSMAAILVVAAGANPEAVPDHDFRPALAKLADLGLPDLSGAVWSKNPSARGDYDYQLAEAGIRISGIWKLAGEPLTLLDAGAIESREWTAQEDRTAYQGGGLMGALRRLGSRNRKPAANPADRFPAADLAAEVDGIVKALSNPDKSRQLNQLLEYSGGGSLGKLLLFAAQIHAAGQADTANRLANTLFHAVPDRESILDAAVSQIASSRYQTIAQHFFEDYDWAAYHKATAELVETFPRGWDGTLGLAILLPLLEKRSSGEPPPAISLPDVTLDPDALRQLERLLERPAENPSAGPDQPPEGFDPAMLGGTDWSSLPAEVRSQIRASFGETDPTGNRTPPHSGSPPRPAIRHRTPTPSPRSATPAWTASSRWPPPSATTPSPATGTAMDTEAAASPSAAGMTPPRPPAAPTIGSTAPPPAANWPSISFVRPCRPGTPVSLIRPAPRISASRRSSSGRNTATSHPSNWPR